MRDDERMTAELDHEYLTPKEVAAIFRITAALLRDWRYRGTGPEYVRLNGLVRYPRTAIEAFPVRMIQPDS